jgi:hypothetical protein
MFVLVFASVTSERVTQNSVVGKIVKVVQLYLKVGSKILAIGERHRKSYNYS